MKVLVCGSRGWEDHAAISNRLRKLPPGAEIIHGAARGADTTAALYARALGIPETGYPARWREQGGKAGILRNLQMLDQQPDLVIAFWDGVSPGTKHVIDEATRRAIPVEVVRTKGSEAKGGKPTTN